MLTESKRNLISQRIESLSEKENPIFPNAEIEDLVSGYLEKREFYLNLLKSHSVPCYVFEPEVLKFKADTFKAAFSSLINNTSFYFAMKCNNHAEVSSEMVKNGYGLDVSSGIELEQALSIGCEDIVFSGPGKTEKELILALDNNSKVKILVDSFGELERLSKLAELKRSSIRIGVRLTTNPKILWRKFGIAPERLEEFYRLSEKCRFISFQGIQFHTSWNLNPSAQCDFIRIIGAVLETVSPDCRKAIEFIDVGGGYWPEQGEWLHYETTDIGAVEKSLEIFDEETRNQHFRFAAQSIKVFADEISRTLNETILQKINCKICFEPGRWICNDAVSLFISVVDIKEPDIAITDAGTNTIGWDRFEYDYFPVINITRPSLKENRFNILGSLCTPHDVWAYNYFGEDIREGDILMIPMQGAYTWSMRQNFIKPIADFIKI